MAVFSQAYFSFFASVCQKRGTHTQSALEFRRQKKETIFVGRTSISMNSRNLYSSGPGTLPSNPSSLAARLSRSNTSFGPVRHPRVWTWMNAPSSVSNRYRVESWAASGADACDAGRSFCASWPPRTILAERNEDET